MNHEALSKYDHIPIDHLPARIAPLTAEQLEQLIEYEREHRNRLPVLEVLERRLAELHAGAQPTHEVPTNPAQPR